MGTDKINIQDENRKPQKGEIVKNKKKFCRLWFVFLGASLLLAGNATAADKVVVVPLGGTVGNATAADVVKGKTFSSEAAGKGVTGTLEQHPMGKSYTNSPTA
jgi:hypothetical protein